ncbi:uncharacterized protein LOC134683686 [Mytilus trossulus]|uniref:uncharacterized protein LOC134683686 n=1 Tax=Mytilus trossulus TaxID=6551 RepID=UPI003006717B
MAEGGFQDGLICNPCDIMKKENVHATSWCENCNQAMCSNCVNHHNAFIGTNRHTVIPLEDKGKIPKFILSLTQLCKEHDKVSEFYCNCHDRPCCVQCVTDFHQQCSKVVPFVDILEEAKTSTALNQVEQSVSDTLKTINEITINRRESINALDEQKQIALKKGESFRKKIDLFLDRVHDTFTKDVQSVHAKQVKEIEEEIYILAQKGVKIQEIEEEIGRMKQFSTNRQTFFGIRHFDEMLSKEISDILKAYEKGTIKETEIEIKLTEKLNDCISTVDTIADVSVQTRTRQHEFLKSGKGHLTISVTENIDRIRLELKKEIVIPPSHIGNTEIKRCLILSDGKLLFLDFSDNMRLVVLDSEGNRHKDVKFPVKPFDIDMISDKKIAVSLPKLKRIDIYESKTFNYEKCIGPLNTKCYDISFVSNNNLAVRTEKEIVILDHRVCARIKSISLSKFLGREISYLKYHKDKLFFITDKCQIHCCDIDGDKIWTFASEDLNDARGLSTDSNGNVYTVDHQNGCVVVISADGKKSKLLPSVLFLKDLYYDRERKKLLVMLDSNNENNISSALLYNVK